MAVNSIQATNTSAHYKKINNARVLEQLQKKAGICNYTDILNVSAPVEILWWAGNVRTGNTHRLKVRKRVPTRNNRSSRAVSEIYITTTETFRSMSSLKQRFAEN